MASSSFHSGLPSIPSPLSMIVSYLGLLFMFFAPFWDYFLLCCPPCDDLGAGFVASAWLDGRDCACFCGRCFDAYYYLFALLGAAWTFGLLSNSSRLSPIVCCSSSISPSIMSSSSWSGWPALPDDFSIPLAYLPPAFWGSSSPPSTWSMCSN